MLTPAVIYVHNCWYQCFLMRISNLTAADIYVYCGYQCLLLQISTFTAAYNYVYWEISMFPTADINVHRCGHLRLLQISMFLTADININRCGYLCSQLRISLFNYCEYIFLNRRALVQSLGPNVDFLTHIILIFIRFSKTMVRLQAYRI